MAGGIAGRRNGFVVDACHAGDLVNNANLAANMNSIEHSFQEFIDAIQTAHDDDSFERVATRVTQRLGFRYFAYLRIVEDAPKLISSYPKSWTSRYFDLHYEQLDPVVRRARVEHDLFSWGSGASAPTGNREQRKFFEEATTFGIESGITVPIRGGFGRVAAFTLATDDWAMRPEQLVAKSKNVVQLVGLYFHTHVAARLGAECDQSAGDAVLTQRECQCLAWAARGKTVADTAVLVGIAPRTVVFHLENARRKLRATSIAQCVAEALRRRLLP
ncbi:autoinducer binding domain-containing protein [Bradyrhizobium sp. LjRoot220]|uniref:autoinducer binding domain-containing protein n=1 Tax=Bradyrhizobium sp. LjRoot220 TaxID=3342284 RepID=UPI003ECCE1BD